MSKYAFAPFAKAVHDNIQKLVKTNELFVVDIEGDELWAIYLRSFPEGTNPMHKTRTEHDCSTCRNFVKNFGGVVAVVDGQKRSIWSVYPALAYPFGDVAKALNDAVLAAPIVNLFRSKEKSYGAQETRQLIDVNGKTVVHTWSHFFSEVPAKCFQAVRKVGNETVSPESVKGAYASGVAVFERGLVELKTSAVDDVLGLIEQNALYRGEEHKGAVTAFRQMQTAYSKAKDKNAYVWANASSPALARFRNSAIGKLVQDLSEGKDLEASVKAFEQMVAPANYKRTTALITPKMIDAAQATLRELGLEAAIDRRFAKLSDVSVNNVLWVDRDARGEMKDGISALLADQVKATASKAQAAVQAVTIEEFMSEVLPKASGLEVFLKGQHLSNFMSITTSDDAARLFKWDNPFAWSYDGNVTDSIKERVAKAGGNVTNAKLRISLAWFNYDDLDIYVTEPDGNTLCFYQKSSINGRLDVDMNISPTTRQAVENVSFTRVQDGIYKVAVSCYTKRERIDVGCTIEVENNGKIVQLSRAAAITDSGRGAGTHIANVHVRNGMVEKIDPAKGVVGGGFSQEKWGVKTEDFVKVNTVMFSPNYWDGQGVGNKHWFFLLEGCKADMPARGIYNEFLRPDLDKHRKVFEVLGDKTKCQVVDEQLSGVGFSSTRKDELTVRVKSGKITKQYNIVF